MPFRCLSLIVIQGRQKILVFPSQFKILKSQTLHFHCSNNYSSENCSLVFSRSNAKSGHFSGLALFVLGFSETGEVWHIRYSCCTNCEYVVKNMTSDLCTLMLINKNQLRFYCPTNFILQVSLFQLFFDILTNHLCFLNLISTS